MKFWREVFTVLRHEDISILEPYLLEVSKDGLSFIEKEDMEYLKNKLPEYLYRKILQIISLG